MPQLHTNSIFTTMLALISISAYFVLNVLVTITNRIIVTQTSSPYLLTASHAAVSYLSTSILARLQSLQPSPIYRVPFASTKLLLFSILFTLNITLSNYTLSLVSLPVHQTIRATAPALTIAFTVLLSLRTWSSYTPTTYFSLVPIIVGVILAANGSRIDTSFLGIFLTFVGAVTAVLKTIATHAIQTHLDIKSFELIRATAPFSFIQSLFMAWQYEEFQRVTHLPPLRTLSTGQPWTWLSMSSLLGLMLLNALLAALLNLTSFEANRRCGPVTMGVAANLKQVALLLIPFSAKKGKGVSPGPQVFAGGLITVVGGVWYTFAQGGGRSGRTLERVETEEKVKWKEKDNDMV
jgi:Triose-phosphate Transporter family